MSGLNITSPAQKLIPIAAQQHRMAEMERKAQTLKTPGSSLDQKQLAQIDLAAKDFEASFLAEMLRPMFEEVNQPDEMFGGGKGEEVFGGMMVDEYAKTMVASGGIGLASYVREEMIRLQEAANGAH
jgi:Rod binding domain-containing protein